VGTVLSPGDVVAGQIARSYLEADGVQGGSASTVHLAQGRTVEHAVAVLDPGQHAASYVALSRDAAPGDHAATPAVVPPGRPGHHGPVVGAQRAPSVDR